MEARTCLVCGESFEPCRTVKNQRYCSKLECQRERKRRWQRAKLADDPDYRGNRADSQRRWRENNRDYWRKYRKSHRAYVKKNRKRQRERNARCRNAIHLIAKMDASDPASPVVSLPCELVISRKDLIAKMDVIRGSVRVSLASLPGPGG